MSSYSYQIRKADHSNPDGSFDLHVHIYRNDYRHRRLLGRYRLPGLEPVFSETPELNQQEIRGLAGWLSQSNQINKLQNCLRETLFDIHRLAEISPRYGKIIPEDGKTYINIRIPIDERIRQ